MHPISITAEPIFHIGSFAVTNTLFTSWIVVIILVILSFVISKVTTNNTTKVPGKLQNAAEAALDKFIDFMTQIAGDRKTAIKFLPICGTIFFFILFSNWLGILPGFGSIGFYHLEDGKQVLLIFSQLNLLLLYHIRLSEYASAALGDRAGDIGDQNSAAGVPSIAAGPVACR